MEEVWGLEMYEDDFTKVDFFAVSKLQQCLLCLLKFSLSTHVLQCILF